jgi:arylformamidase
MSGPVYRSYSQAELDAQYDQRTLVSDMSPYIALWREKAEKAAAGLKPEAGVAYGRGANETLDVFRSSSSFRGIHVHYHGGAWRALSSQDCWFLAEPWVAAGYTFVAVNFDLVPAVPLVTQVEQARRALVWCADNTGMLGGAVDQITLSGHSSGAHLAAMAGLTQWSEPAPAVRAVILASGPYDLEPVRLSARNDYLKLDKAQALALSPVRNLLAKPPPCSVIWSTNELDEFQRQSAEMAGRLEQRGAVLRLPLDVPTHFDTWEMVHPSVLKNVFCEKHVPRA